MKIYIRQIFCLFLSTALFITTGNAQVLPDLQNSFNQYNLNTLQEKLFVHTDKEAYTAGELIWFKIYNVDGTDHRPIDISKVVYIELLDNNQNPVLQAKISMKNGAGNGSIYVPVTISSGNYLLRAYTSWMKNFSPDFYFNKKLVIINPLRSPDIQAKTVSPDYDIQFFPEGGNLVNGITSVVGFKATNQAGKGINFKGAVLDKNNDTVVRFTPYKFGMGKFSFKPDNQNTYHAVINIDGKNIQKALPKVYNSGYVMNLTDNGVGKLSVKISTTLSSGNIYLFAHTRNIINVVETATINNGIAQFSIDQNKLGDGISHLTVFNNEKQPVCERLYFKQPAKKLFINPVADKQEYNTRRKVNIVIDTKDQNSNPVVADMSVSVYRLDSLQGVSKEDIQSYLWLRSDLKGFIESPEYYFNNKDAGEAADNLMLTQGWRRFNWSEVLGAKPAFNFLPEYNGPIITAKITDQTTGKPVNNVVTYISIPGKRVQMYTSLSDSLGRLKFNMKGFYGPGEIVAETNTEIDTNYHIDILNPFSEQYANVALGRLSITAGMKTAIENESLGMQVQNIYNAAKLRQFYDPGVDSSAFYGTPYKTYILDNYTRFTTMEEVMREYVTEVNVSHLKNQFHILVLTDNNAILNKGNPLVMIDGVPFFNMNKLFALDPLKVRKLEDVPATYYWGPSVNDGIFSFTTYKGDLGGAELDPHAVVMDYDGLELQRQFYSPQYDTDKAYMSRVPDFRNVLYWEPDIITSTQGKNNLSFYTSDQTGNYIGVVQGLTANGEAGSQYFLFKVTK